MPDLPKINVILRELTKKFEHIYFGQSSFGRFFSLYRARFSVILYRSLRKSFVTKLQTI